MYYTMENFMKYDNTFYIAEENYMFALEGLSVQSIAAKIQKLFSDLILRITRKVKTMKDGKIKQSLLRLLQRANTGLSKAKALNEQNPEKAKELQAEAESINEELKELSGNDESDNTGGSGGNARVPVNAKYTGGPGKANSYLQNNSKITTSNNDGSNPKGSSTKSGSSQNGSNPKGSSTKSGSSQNGSSSTQSSSTQTSSGYDNSAAKFIAKLNKKTRNRYQSELNQAASGNFDPLRRKLGSGIYNSLGNMLAIKSMNADINIIKGDLPAVFERHDGESMDMDKEHWDYQYCKKLANGLGSNFSITRYNHFLAVNGYVNGLGSKLKHAFSKKNKKSNEANESFGYYDDADWIYATMESLSYYDTDNLYDMNDYYYAFEAYELDNSDTDDYDFAFEDYDDFGDLEDFAFESYDDFEDEFEYFSDESFYGSEDLF